MVGHRVCKILWQTYDTRLNIHIFVFILLRRQGKDPFRGTSAVCRYVINIGPDFFRDWLTTIILKLKSHVTTFSGPSLIFTPPCCFITVSPSFNFPSDHSKRSIIFAEIETLNAIRGVWLTVVQRWVKHSECNTKCLNHCATDT